MEKIIFVGLIIIIILIILLVCLVLVDQYYWTPNINMENKIKLVFTIDGQIVGQSQFEETKSKLDISKEYKYTAPIEANPADPVLYPSGTETVYDAINKETGKKCFYIEIIYPNKQVFEIREQ